MSSEIVAVEGAGAIDKALAAWAEALDAAEPVPATVAVELDTAPGAAFQPSPGTGAAMLAGDGFVERLLGEQVDAAVPVSEPARPGMDGDPGHESATVQTFSRAPASPGDAPRHAGSALPFGHHARSEFAVPAALLVPVALSGLQVEAAAGWPLARGGEPERRVNRRDGEPRDSARDDEHHVPHEDEAPARSPAQRDGAAAGSADGVVLDDAGAADWCETLSRALQQALSARIAPQALLTAAEQWRRGRCVVLACPQTADPAGAAWAFVLWPRVSANLPAQTPDAAGALALFGLRVEARLQWRTLPPWTPWCHVRVIKEHHPRRGRQLVPADADGAATTADAALACEVQLGPVLARSLRWCEVRVHIQAAQRFWAALGRQWSVHVVVCALPLVAPSNPTPEATRC